MGPSQDRHHLPTMSSACLLSTEKFYPKNKFNQRNFKSAETKKNDQTE